MSEYVPKEGDHAIVSIEGVITRRVDAPAAVGRGWFYFLPDGANINSSRHFYVEHGDGEPVTVELIPEREPAWQPGDSVLGGNGKMYGYIDGPHPWCEIRFEGGALMPSWVSVNGINDVDVPRPLVPLTRNGKPWAEAAGGAS